VITLTRFSRFSSRSDQRGMVVIGMSLILLVAVSLLLVNSGKTSILEQSISYNEFRAAEAHHAADAGLEYARAWYADNNPTWSTGSIPADCVGTFDESFQLKNQDLSLPGMTTLDNDTYELHMYFCRNRADRSIIQIVSRAKLIEDKSVQYMVREYVMPDTDFLSAKFSGAPLIVDGCTSNTNGTPDIWPDNAPLPNIGVSYETSLSQTDAESLAINPGIICIQATNSAGMALNGGIVKHSAFTAGNAWDYVFRVPRSEIQSRATFEISSGYTAAQRQYYFYDNFAQPTFNSSLGSPSHPVVLVFTGTSGCPKINGNVTIYGIVFIDGPCPAASGWGNANFYGSVIIGGNANHLTANTQFYDWRYQASPTNWRPVASTDWRPRFSSETAVTVIGTWSDF